MPVGKLSAVEHSGLTDENACPTYSAWTLGKSRKNVETPAVGLRPTEASLRSPCVDPEVYTTHICLGARSGEVRDSLSPPFYCSRSTSAAPPSSSASRTL